MDWTIFHALNGSLRGDDGGQDAAVAFNATAIFVLVAIAGGLWFVARPGGSLRPKLAAVSAGAAAVSALVLNAVLGQLWYHARPFIGHPHQTLLLVHHAGNNSFPSDHASVGFAIAFAVLAFYRRLGLVFLIGASAIALDRILVGVHYPLDVAASVLVGAIAAMLVVTLGRGAVAFVVEQASRVSDPIVARIHGPVRP